MVKLKLNENINNNWYNPNYDKKQLFEIWKINDLNKNDNIFMSITKNINLGKHICAYIKTPEDKNTIFYIPTCSKKKIVLNIQYLKDNKKIIESFYFNDIINTKIKYNEMKFKYDVSSAYALIFNLDTKKEWCDINYEKII